MAFSVCTDLGWTDHTLLKVVQFHQYPSSQVQEVELFDDYDVLRQGGGDGGPPPVDDRFSQGPHIESIHSGEGHSDPSLPDDERDPTDVPVPAGDTYIDLEDEVFWTSWIADIRADEYHFTEKFQKQKTQKTRRLSSTKSREGEEPPAPCPRRRRR